MHDLLLAAFPWFSLAGVALTALTAGVARGRYYAVFSSVLLTLHSLIATSLARYVGPFLPAYALLHALVFIHFLMLAKPALRPIWYRATISLPASYFAAAVFLAFPWAIAAGLGMTPRVVVVPFAIAGVGLAQSLRRRFEERDVVLDGQSIPTLARQSLGGARVTRPLKIVQLTDPHLGPFMSETRLRRIAERAVAAQPDLVLLTGDFLTMESHDAQAVLARALAPLAQLPGRVFACRGNHDHEAPETVAGALRDIGARLLIDEACTLQTEAGLVQILGIDFHFRERARKTVQACTRHPRLEGALRVVMLHDPGAFVHVPDGEADLVFSGHTHGGQLGLVSLGLPLTVVSAFSKIPDHGLWALGKNRLYVHRGTGHYGFPLRVGVPAEESLLRVHDVTPERATAAS